jgi:hypothetical protein
VSGYLRARVAISHLSGHLEPVLFLRDIDGRKPCLHCRRECTGAATATITALSLDTKAITLPTVDVPKACSARSKKRCELKLLRDDEEETDLGLRPLSGMPPFRLLRHAVFADNS